MGDGEKEIEDYLINAYNLGKMDILKVGYHVSRTSSSKSFINVINPCINLISAGKNNLYGHPHKETLERLENIQILITALDGSVKIIL